jgi:hypothetical protein
MFERKSPNRTVTPIAPSRFHTVTLAIIDAVSPSHSHTFPAGVVAVQNRFVAVILAFTLALVLVSGCSGTPPAAPPQPLTPTNFDKIKDGMSLVEVDRILGPWSNFSRDAMVKINGADTRVVQYHWKRGDKEITVNFVNDKAVSKSSQSLEGKSDEAPSK